MTDNYVELLVKRRTTPILKAMRFTCLVMSVFHGFVLLMTRSPFYIVPFVGFFILSHVIAFFGNVEYEYLYLDRHLSIDQINNERKRKKVAEYVLERDMEILAPVGSGRLEQYKDRISKVKNYTGEVSENEKYAMVVRSANEFQMIEIEMNDELFGQIAALVPRKVFKD